MSASPHRRPDEHRPLVSVVVPVHNCQRYLTQALRSVLDQTYRHLEVVVVDDGSTDGTPEILGRMSHPALRSIRHSHAGTAAALNRGIEETDGALVSFLDADDLWTPTKLALQVAALARDRQLDLVFGHLRQFHSPELTAAQRATIACTARPIPGVHRGTMLIRREVLVGVGPFSSAWRVCEFVDWYARAMALGLRSVVLPDVVMLRRLHSSNSTLSAPETRVEYVRIARAALHRRRAAGRMG